MKFVEVQKAFTRHIRDPENNPAPAGIEDRRMGIYRDLLYRNVESFMSNSFPVLRKITPDEQWHKMIRHYFKTHVARTPLFPKMPQEFLQYLQQERVSGPDDFPFLAELAHYEWVEVELSLDVREITVAGVDSQGDLLESVPVLNELVLALSYKFPVHRIGPEFIPQQAPEQPTYLVVYRNRNHDIGFLELNPVSARLLELMQQGSDQTGRELLQEITMEIQHPEPEVVIQGGLDIMQAMLDKDILLGTRKMKPH